MTPEQEIYLTGFLHATRQPGSSQVRHKDGEVMDEIAGLLEIACLHHRIPRISVHHPERGARGIQDEAVITLPQEILRRIDKPLDLIFQSNRGLQVHLERGILEGCGTLCHKKSTRGIGISFTSRDESWLKILREEIARHHPCGALETSSRGVYWFGISHDACASYVAWLYGDPQMPHSRTRRLKLQKVLNQLGQSTRGGEMPK